MDDAGNGRVRLSISDDHGRTLGSAITLDDQAPLGRVDVTVLSDKSVVVSWLAQDDGKGKLKVCLVSASGQIRQTLVVAEVSKSRGSGFATLQSTQTGAVIAWTELQGKNKRVRTAYLAFP